MGCSFVHFVRVVVLYTLPFNRPQRKKSAGVRSVFPVSKFLPNFWMQNFNSACRSINSVRNAIWHALNEPLFMNEKLALFDSILRQLFAGSSDRLTLYYDSHNNNISHTMFTYSPEGQLREKGSTYFPNNSELLNNLNNSSSCPSVRNSVSVK